MAHSENCLKLYEAVCFADEPLRPRDDRFKDLVLIVRAKTHARVARIVDEWLLRQLGASEVFFCRSIRHIGYDLNSEAVAGERILHRFRKTLAVNLGYPEWIREERDSHWTFVGPSVEADRPMVDSSSTSPASAGRTRRSPRADGSDVTP